YSREEVIAESTRCLQCTCEAIGFCDLRRLGIEYGTTLQTLEPQFHQGAGYRSVTENRFTGVNHDYIRDDSHAFILREPSRCIDACPYGAVGGGADFELSHLSRAEPMIDLMAIAAVDMETEVTYIRRERDWAARAAAEGRFIDPGRLLPVLPASIAEQIAAGA